VHLRMFVVGAVVAVSVACTSVTVSTSGPDRPADQARADPSVLTIYSRERDVAEPLFERFEQETGIQVRARWGDPVDLAEQIISDGGNTPADVFYAPVSDALGALSAAGRLATLSTAQLDWVPEAYRSPSGTWVGTTGRAHVVFYNTDNLSADDLPDSILGFADPAWRGRIAWDPTSRSLQDAVTALRQVEGEDVVRSWLGGIQAGKPAVLQGARPIVDAVSAGQIADIGFGSHYYLYDAQADGAARNVAAKFYPGDPGGLLNVAGIGIIKGTDNSAAASALVDFMLSETVQRVYADEANEIPLVKEMRPAGGIPTPDELAVPGLDLRRFEKLDDARRLLVDAGVIG
jgi:iron(III) transport system substrate-binding protein